MSFIQLDSNKFEQFLSEKGFSRYTQGNEVVYMRKHEYNPNIWIKVYTSIREGELIARECGKDAIRIVAIYDNNRANFALAKMPRVYRTTSQEEVHKRTLMRMREAYKICSAWIRKNKRLSSMTPCLKARACS